MSHRSHDDFKIFQIFFRGCVCNISLKGVKDEDTCLALCGFSLFFPHRCTAAVSNYPKRDDCWVFLGGFTQSLGSWRPFIRVLMQTWAWKTNWAGKGREGMGRPALSGLCIDTPKREGGQTTSFSLSALNCSTRQLHQHFRRIWKRGIMQERRH